MRNPAVSCLRSLLVIVLLTPLAFSQRRHHPYSYDGSTADKFNFSVGGGVSTPTDEAGQDLNTGYNFDVNGGYNFSRYVSGNLDFSYNRWGLNDAALARFQEPGGRTSVWSLTLNPVVHFNPEGKVDVYTTGGFGVYHSNLSLTEPFNETTFVCDPFFGFCFPQTGTVNEVVASFRTTKGGFNAGGGFSVRLGESSKLRFFTEARYHRMFNSTGADVTFVPVTFGIRW
jgi:opacity protein-like surface antigen